MVKNGEWEIVMNLDTGERTLRRGSIKPVEKERKPIPTKRWWDQTGSRAFLYAAEGWRQNEAADFAGEFGYNVENGGPLMITAETEEALRSAFKTARRLGISSIEVARTMKSATQMYRERLGGNADWLPEFTASATGLLAEVYGLGAERAKALQKYQFLKNFPK